MSDYTYFYAFDEKLVDGFIEHVFLERHSVEYLRSTLERIGIEWYDRSGVIADVKTYTKLILKPYIGKNKPDDLDTEDEEKLQDLHDFLMKWKKHKIMIFSEEHYLTA